MKENWTIVNRVNQISLLPKMDLFISHGGINSVREAMHFGVPIIIIPSEGDTFFSAEDVLRNGVGDIVSINELSRLEQCVKNIIDNSSVKNSCSRISSIMKYAPGIDGAVMYLEKIMNKENI